MSEKLRVGVLLNSLDLRAWEWTMLHRVIGSTYAELTLIVISPFPPSLRDYDAHPRIYAKNSLSRLSAWILQRVHELLESKIECEHDAFGWRDGAALLSHIPKIDLLAAAARGDDARDAKALSQIRRFDLDVLVHLASDRPTALMSTLAKHGIWFFDCQGYRRDSCAPAGFWEVYFGWPVTTMVLQSLAKDGATRVLARSISATHQLSVKLNRSGTYWKLLSALSRRLEQLQRLGERSFFEKAERHTADGLASGDRLLGSPRQAQLAIHIGRNLKRRAAAFLSRKFTRQQWILLFHPGAALPTSVQQFRKIVPPSDRYWADPHVVKRNGRCYLFVEEYLFSSAKGHISVLEIDEQGRHSAPVTVLERDHHLSYPFVFEHDGTLFMVPESSAAGTVELYRCVNFPTRWEFVRYLLKDIFAVDATLLHHDGKWWLFANVVENPGTSPCEELFLFHGNSLFTGEWTPHPLNPIVTDVRRCRPAGAIFHHGGKLYRPAQDCSVRYGYGIRINEITVLSTENYEESEVASLTPDCRENITATHTLARTDELTVIDALQPRLGFC